MTDDIKCPVCGSQTHLRTSKKDGSKFHVCVNWPDCRGKVALDKGSEATGNIFKCPMCKQEADYQLTKQKRIVKLKTYQLHVISWGNFYDFYILSCLNCQYSMFITKEAGNQLKYNQKILYK